MSVKYESALKFAVARARRALLRSLLDRLAKWEPMPGPPEPGYTMIIGVPGKVASILAANLALVARCDLTSCRQVICVFDRRRERCSEDVEAKIRRAWAGPDIRFVYYDVLRERVLDAVGYSCAYSWHSWQMGIARTRTRHALLHDFDAFVLDPGLFERRYRHAVDTGATWLGQRWYRGNGIDHADHLTTTFEMILDAELVRSRFTPIDLFNRIAKFDGRRVEFDVTLWAQTLTGGSESLDIAEEQLVHPSQVVKQLCDLTHTPAGRYDPPERNRLPFVPYLLDLAGDPSVLPTAVEELRRSDRFSIVGLPVRLARTEVGHVEWIAKCAGLIETSVHGRTRPVVAEYFGELLSAVRRARGDDRAVPVVPVPVRGVV